MTIGYLCISYRQPLEKINRDKEENMFEVTEKASDMIRETLKDREEIPPIRIMLSQGG